MILKSWSKSCVMLLCICCSVLFFACGSDGGSNNPVDSSAEDDGSGGSGSSEENVPLLTTEQVTILQNASEIFETLIQTESRENARQTIVEKLNETDGVKTAKLMEDEVTVWIMYDDGMSSVLYTVDFDALNAHVSEIDYDTLKPAVKKSPAEFPKISAIGSVEHDLAPEAYKVLMLNNCEPTVPSANNANKLHDILINAGWLDDDIVMKTREDRYDTSIQPGDVFGLGEYGIVVIYAHGIYGTPPDSSVTNHYHYLQICSSLSDEDPLAPQYREWALSGQLVLSDKCGVFIRNDLLFTLIETMPRSIVFFNVCWGWASSSVFSARNCGAFFGWDDMAMAADVYPSLYQSFKLLTQGFPANTMLDIFESDLVVKSSANMFGRTAELHVMLAETELYSPAWVDVSVNTATLPAKTTEIEINAKYESTILTRTVFEKLDGGTVTDMVPGLVNFTATAYDGATELAIQEMEVEFSPGQNNILLDFSYQIASAQLYVHTWETEPGRYSTIFVTYYVWKKNTDGNTYHITFCIGDKTYATREITHPEAREDYDELNQCLGPDEVTEIFGNNVFALGAGEVVFYTVGSQYINYDGNDTEMLEKIEQKRVDMLKYIKNDYYKVYYD